MMKSFLFLPLLMLAITFTSCKKEEITQEVVIPNRTIVTDIAPTDWQLATNGSYYRVTINMPEINQAVYDNDAVLAYFSFDGTNYEAIPDVFQGSTLTVTHAVGKVYVDIQGADGGPVDPPGETIRVKIVIVESGLVD